MVRISGDTSGGTRHIMVTPTADVTAYGNVDGGAQAAAADDFGGLIGVSGTGDSTNVEGVDIIDRAFNFDVTKTFAVASKPSLETLYLLTGTLNSAPFSVTDTETGWVVSLPYARLCLFRGASFGQSHVDSDGETAVDVTYSFSVSPTVTKSIDNIGNVTKGGFDYLWVRTIHADMGNVMVENPVSAYVHQVYESDNWTGLGL
jgi:hypothetical protein